MDSTKIKNQLEALLAETKDVSARKQIEILLSELESSTVNAQLSDPSKIPKPVLKKIVDFIARFFLKLAEYKAIRILWEELEKMDFDT